MKQPKQKSKLNYYAAVELIAMNDEPGNLDIRSIERSFSTNLIADIFGRKTVEVAIDILERKIENGGMDES